MKDNIFQKIVSLKYNMPEISMFLEVSSAKYLSDYKISLLFNNGESKTVDLSDKLIGKVFEPLKDKASFQSFVIKFNTIEWSSGADFAPEYLYEIGT
jgi:hypothetical protein